MYTCEERESGSDRERETERETDRQRDRQRDRQTDRGLHLINYICTALNAEKINKRNKTCYLL